MRVGGRDRGSGGSRGSSRLKLNLRGSGRSRGRDRETIVVVGVVVVEKEKRVDRDGILGARGGRSSSPLETGVVILFLILVQELAHLFSVSEEVGIIVRVAVGVGSDVEERFEGWI